MWGSGLTRTYPSRLDCLRLSLRLRALVPLSIPLHLSPLYPPSFVPQRLLPVFPFPVVCRILSAAESTLILMSQIYNPHDLYAMAFTFAHDPPSYTVHPITPIPRRPSPSPTPLPTSSTYFIVVNSASARLFCSPSFAVVDLPLRVAANPFFLGRVHGPRIGIYHGPRIACTPQHPQLSYASA